MKKKYMTPLINVEMADMQLRILDPTDDSQIDIGPGTGGRPDDDDDPAKERRGIWGSDGKLW